jgi:DNA replication protein DnaC
MDIKEFFIKTRDNNHIKDMSVYKKQFTNLIKRNVKDNLISKEDYTFIKNCTKTSCKLTTLDKFIKLINFEDPGFMNLFGILFENINKIINNKKFDYLKLIDNFKNNNSIISFTQDHINGMKLIFNMIYDTNINSVGLYGYAGTGKTTLITKIVDYMLKKKYIHTVAFSAPTHKALDVLKFKFYADYNNCDNTDNIDIIGKVDFVTIHKLLGYKKDFNENGDFIFVNSAGNLLANYDLIIMDECSMIPVDVVNKILSEISISVIKKQNPKVIFVGDPAQLPPVNEQISELFKNDILSVTLTQVVRNKNDDVNNFCNDIRDWVTGKVTIPEFRLYGNNVKLYKYNKNVKKIDTKWFSNYLTHMKSTSSNNNSVIILTWTNDQCSEYNRIARETILNIDGNKKINNKKNNIRDNFKVGDILIFNNYYNCNQYNNSNNGSRFYTSEQIKIVEIEQVAKCLGQYNIQLPKIANKLPNFNDINAKYKNIINHINKNTSKTYNSWKLKVQRLCENTVAENNVNDCVTIYVLHNDSKNIWEREVAFIKGNIKEFCDIYKNLSYMIPVIKYLWKMIDETYVGPFADVKEGFCITTHKSQGSTFCNVFIDCHDIFKNRDRNVYIRCIYTALTRASNKVHVLI